MNDMYNKGTVRRISIERRVCMASSEGVCVLSVFWVGACCLGVCCSGGEEDRVTRIE